MGEAKFYLGFSRVECLLDGLVGSLFTGKDNPTRSVTVENLLTPPDPAWSDPGEILNTS